MISTSVGWFILLIAAAVAIAIGILMPVLAPADVFYGKGGPGPNPLYAYLPSILLLGGAFGIVLGVAGVMWSRPSWRRLSVFSVFCGGLALLLEPWWPLLGGGYAGIWLGGLLSLLAIGAAIGAFVTPMRNKAVDVSLAVLGLLAGVPSVLFAVWILGLTLGGSMGE